MTEFEARVILLVVPSGVPTAARVSVGATVDAETQYAGEMDESTETTITVSATGYAEDGKQMWSYSRDYDQFTGYDRNDPSAPYGLMRLIADLAKTDPQEAAHSSSRPPAYKTEESTSGHEYRGGFPG
jgi:hypothetical protein